MRIPKRFKLFEQTIAVTFDPKNFIEQDGYQGFACYRTNQIQLRESNTTTPRSDDQINQTFYHELMHFILYHAGAANTGKKDYLHQEEGLVDLCGSLLHQALATMEYDE